MAEAKDEVELVEGSVFRDHICVCLRITPTHSVAKVMCDLMGKSAQLMFDHRLGWRAGTVLGRAFWALGDCIRTVGLNVTVIRKCVRNREDASRIVNRRYCKSCPCRNCSFAARSAVIMSTCNTGGCLLLLVPYHVGYSSEDARLTRIPARTPSKGMPCSGG